MRAFPFSSCALLSVSNLFQLHNYAYRVQGVQIILMQIYRSSCNDSRFFFVFAISIHVVVLGVFIE